MKKTYMAAAVALMLGVTVSNVLAATKHTQAKQLDKYLYEMTYTDYDYADYKDNLVKSHYYGKFACSSVHNGRYFGRNFDFFYNDVPQYVIHVPAAEGRYASMGLAYPFAFKLESDMDEQDWKVLPWHMLDGVNEKGVGVNINVCPINDLESYIAPEGTNPKAKVEVDMLTVVRYLLDNAKSAKHGLKLLQEANIVENFTKHPAFAKSGFGLHLMVCDKKHNYVVEFVNNKLQYVEENVMTNFFNTLPEYTDHSTGVERYNILKDYYDLGGQSMESMMKLMRKAMFSLCYSLNTKPVRYTDFCLGYNKDIGEDITLKKLYGSTGLRMLALDFLQDVKVVRNDPKIWITTSTSIYDLHKKKWHLYIQENYNKRYEFTL